MMMARGLKNTPPRYMINSPSPDAFTLKNETDLDNLGRLMAGIVEGSFGGVRAPRSREKGQGQSGIINEDEVFANIFLYDLYGNLSMIQDQKRIEAMANKSEERPLSNKWFTGWFLPIYLDGKDIKNKNDGESVQNLVRFFKLRKDFYPQENLKDSGPTFSREMNLGGEPIKKTMLTKIDNSE